MSNFVLDLVNQYGYLGMFLGMVLEAVIIVIPSEAILATGGILASQKIFTFWGAFLTGLIGSVFCAIVIYFMGYFGGKPFINRQKFPNYQDFNISPNRNYEIVISKIYYLYNNRKYSLDISFCLCRLHIR